MQLKNNTMKLISKNLLYSFLILFSLSFISCDSGTRANTENDSFLLEKYKWDEVPVNIKNQLQGGGCVFYDENNESFIYMTDGLVKINGIYEILQDNTTTSLDDPKQVFENNRWIITIEMEQNNTDPYKEPGILTIRSKERDGEETVKVQRYCGT